MNTFVVVVFSGRRKADREGNRSRRCRGRRSFDQYVNRSRRRRTLAVAVQVNVNGHVCSNAPPRHDADRRLKTPAATVLQC
jgi:hypothetical protein